MTHGAFELLAVQPSLRIVLSPLIIFTAYLITLAFSGFIVRTAMRWTGHDAPLTSSDPKENKAKSGLLIGKCENFLVVTLVLLDAFTALALIFTAKSLVRKDQVPDAEYFLGGTLVNVTWSLGVGLLARWIIMLLPA